MEELIHNLKQTAYRLQAEAQALLNNAAALEGSLPTPSLGDEETASPWRAANGPEETREARPIIIGPCPNCAALRAENAVLTTRLEEAQNTIESKQQTVQRLFDALVCPAGRGAARRRWP
jgi:uncharacterized protein (DUF1778 family)